MKFNSLLKLFTLSDVQFIGTTSKSFYNVIIVNVSQKMYLFDAWKYCRPTTLNRSL